MKLISKHVVLAGLCLISASSISAESSIARKIWIHGSADCKSNTDPAIEVFRYDQSSYILRQNMCLNFEAPFIYVLLGDKKALVLDTGATESAVDFPLYETVQSLVNELPVLVMHSHSHRDHYRGDSQFEGKPNVKLVKPNFAAVSQFFDFREWPDEKTTLELGNRKLTIIPTPGHQEEAISVYDPHTQWLLTGDTFYPGYIYVKNWDAYKMSIARLAAFSETHDISAVLGAHIEKTDRADEYYPVGTTYQPNEASLSLSSENLVALNSKLKTSKHANELVSDQLTLIPMNSLQKTLSSMARWFTQ